MNRFLKQLIQQQKASSEDGNALLVVLILLGIGSISALNFSKKNTAQFYAVSSFGRKIERDSVKKLIRDNISCQETLNHNLWDRGAAYCDSTRLLPLKFANGNSAPEEISGYKWRMRCNQKDGKKGIEVQLQSTRKNPHAQGKTNPFKTVIRAEEGLCSSFFDQNPCEEGYINGYAGGTPVCGKSELVDFDNPVNPWSRAIVKEGMSDKYKMVGPFALCMIVQYKSSHYHRKDLSSRIHSAGTHRETHHHKVDNIQMNFHHRMHCQVRPFRNNFWELVVGNGMKAEKFTNECQFRCFKFAKQ